MLKEYWNYFLISVLSNFIFSEISVECPVHSWSLSLIYMEKKRAFFCHFCLNKLIVKILDESTKVGWIGFAKYSRQILGLVSYIRGNPLRPMSSLFCCYLWINMPFVDKYDFFNWHGCRWFIWQKISNRETFVKYPWSKDTFHLWYPRVPIILQD